MMFMNLKTKKARFDRILPLPVKLGGFEENAVEEEGDRRFYGGLDGYCKCDLESMCYGIICYPNNLMIKCDSAPFCYQVPIPQSENKNQTNYLIPNATQNFYSYQKEEIPESSLSSVKKFKIKQKLLSKYKCKTQTVKNSKGCSSTVYTCLYEGCGKQFTRTWSIFDHVRMHEGEKPYKCSHCSRRYTQKGNLEKHMLLHDRPDINSRRSHLCEHCGKLYTEKYNLKVSYSQLIKFYLTLPLTFSKCNRLISENFTQKHMCEDLEFTRKELNI
ncbi:unnamed protein product [Moneuplotes crassus]|uniref:C2H2-type domain-containing protein n=1 Tax=Euplotes crassus TaxID=5936 RepID=A0AAD1TZU9_EUPCR|nr:unnamed protein product [Moneuplotes crassus]